jgi:pimeloyl-ACP methyl ester carboxylesterase
MSVYDPEHWQHIKPLLHSARERNPAERTAFLNEACAGNRSHVKVPTLVMHCRDEVVVPFEEGRLLAGRIPSARFVPLEGRNHLLLESDPAWPVFVGEVPRFLDSDVQAVQA